MHGYACGQQQFKINHFDLAPIPQKVPKSPLGINNSWMPHNHNHLGFEWPLPSIWIHYICSHIVIWMDYRISSSCKGKEILLLIFLCKSWLIYRHLLYAIIIFQTHKYICAYIYIRCLTIVEFLVVRVYGLLLITVTITHIRTNV